MSKNIENKIWKDNYLKIKYKKQRKINSKILHLIIMALKFLKITKFKVT